MKFEEISLADAVEFIVDNRGKSVPVVDKGFPLIATNCISNNRLYPEFKSLRYVSKTIYENWFRSHPLPNDVIITNKGSQNGAVCLVPNPVTFCIAQDMVALRAKQGVVYPLYLLAALRSEQVQFRIRNLNVDAVIPHLKKTDFNKLFFPIPDYETQRAIGDFYFKICSKIELNIEINQTLEQSPSHLQKLVCRFRAGKSQDRRTGSRRQRRRRPARRHAGHFRQRQSGANPPPSRTARSLST